MNQETATGFVVEMERAHACELPDLIAWGPPKPGGDSHWSAGLPTIAHEFPEGSRFYCNCGEIWVARYRPSQRRGSVMVMGGMEWGRETRRERRRRLGLKWWRTVRPPT